MTIQSVFIQQFSAGQWGGERAETASPDQGHSGEDGRAKSIPGTARHACDFRARHSSGCDYLLCFRQVSSTQRLPFGDVVGTALPGRDGCYCLRWFLHRRSRHGASGPKAHAPGLARDRRSLGGRSLRQQRCRRPLGQSAKLPRYMPVCVNRTFRAGRRTLLVRSEPRLRPPRWSRWQTPRDFRNSPWRAGNRNTWPVGRRTSSSWWSPSRRRRRRRPDAVRGRFRGSRLNSGG